MRLQYKTPPGPGPGRARNNASAAGDARSGPRRFRLFAVCPRAGRQRGTRGRARRLALYQRPVSLYRLPVRLRCQPGYGDGGGDNAAACWSLRDWVENALVERNRPSNGCPASGFDTSVHALGLLNTAQCPSATSGADCWFLQPLTSDGAAVTELNLVAGKPIEVQLVYRFTPPLVGDFIGLGDNPIAITRTAIMKVQNN